MPSWPRRPAPKFLRRALPSIASVVLALLLCFVAIALTRGDLFVARNAYLQMLWGGVGNLPSFFEGGELSVLTRAWGETGVKASLLTLTGLSVAVAFSVGLFNIGAHGQLIVGAFVAAIVGAKVNLPAGLHCPFSVLAAATAGAAYASVAAWLKVARRVHEVISTIMLNWVAVSLVENWLVVGPFRATAAGTSSISGTDEILLSARLPRLLGDLSRLNAGVLIAFLATTAVWFWLLRSRFGFETRAVGLGMEASKAAGIPVNRRLYIAMAASGALAGMAGAVLVLGTEYKFPATLSAPYGFDGIAISLIGQNHPLGVFVTALVFGALRAGGTGMQLFQVHKSFPELIQGLALLFVAGQLIWERLLQRAMRADRGEVPRA